MNNCLLIKIIFASILYSKVLFAGEQVQIFEPPSNFLQKATGVNQEGPFGRDTTLEQWEVPNPIPKLLIGKVYDLKEFLEKCNIDFSSDGYAYYFELQNYLIIRGDEKALSSVRLNFIPNSNIVYNKNFLSSFFVYDVDKDDIELEMSIYHYPLTTTEFTFGNAFASFTLSPSQENLDEFALEYNFKYKDYHIKGVKYCYNEKEVDLCHIKTENNSKRITYYGARHEFSTNKTLEELTKLVEKALLEKGFPKKQSISKTLARPCSVITFYGFTGRP